MLITKASGEQEEFDEKKLRRSLEKIGAKKAVIDRVLKQVEKELTEGISTSEIYKRAFELLKKEKMPLAARYSMRQAIVEMGPSGFPFEAFVAEVFRTKGYEVLTDQHIMGRCVEHEIDVLAKGEDRFIVLEAKFKNQPGFKTDLKSALYVGARYKDVLEGGFLEKEGKGLKPEGWLFTNAKFTTNAIQYGKCIGLKLVGWGYPEKGSLANMIEETSVHPITALTTLTKQEKNRLFEKDIVLCKQLRENNEALALAGVDSKRIQEVIKEADLLCGSGTSA